MLLHDRDGEQPGMELEWSSKRAIIEPAEPAESGGGGSGPFQ
jgi:hypothetical protein